MQPIHKSRAFTGVVLALGLTSLGILISALAWQEDGADAGTSGSDPVNHEALQDGHVSRAELDAAFQSMLACLDEEGLPYSEPVWNADAAVPMWEYRVGPMPQDNPSAGSAAHDDCWAEHLRDVQGQWARQHAPTADERERNEAAAVECAEDLGITVESFDELESLDMQQFDDDSKIQRALLGCEAMGHTGVNPVE